MSKELVRFENLKQIVAQVQPQFDDLAKIHNAVNYKREASFALQALTDNDYLASIAMGNQDSLKRAIINVAAIGLSLSPVYKLAYLVPRKKQVYLDLSYQGYIQLATDCGAIKWAHADIVCEKDTFKMRGLGIEPLHDFKPFHKRGPIIGAYCCVKTHDGDFITTVMHIEEVYSIRDRSESWKAGGSGPWKSDPEEMIKKTVIRRAYKSWPKTDTRKRFDEAIDVTNEVDPIDFNANQIAAPEENNERENDLAFVREGLQALGRTEEKYIAHLCTVYNREIKAIEDLTDIEMEKAITMLNQLLDNKKAADAKAIEAKAKKEEKKQSPEMDELDRKLGL